MSSLAIQTHKMVKEDYQGSFVTSAVAMGYRKFVWDNAIKPIDTQDNKDAFMREVAKVEKYIVVGALAAVTSAAVAFIVTKSFIAIAVLSPLLIGITAVAIYSIKHKPQIPDLQPKVVYITPMNPQEAQLYSESIAYLKSKNIDAQETYNWMEDLNHNLKEINKYWSSLSFQQLINEGNGNISQLSSLWGYHTQAIQDRTAAFHHQTFWELAGCDVNFSNLPQGWIFIKEDYVKAVCNKYQEDYIQELMLNSQFETSLVNETFLQITLELKAPTYVPPTAPVFYYPQY